MKIITIKQTDKQEASSFISKYHYRKIMPKLNKVFYGGYDEKNELVAIITFGWGTQPKNTIQKMFPKLDTKDYFEVGRLCLVDELPRNSESEFLSKVFKQLKLDYPALKVIFSWSDGIMGKPGFVYQASNFLYAGKITTDVYITKEGYLIHPRSAKKLLEANAFFEHTKKLFWLTDTFCRKNSILHLKGFQFKYVYLLGSKKDKKELLRESIVPLTLNYPKMEDIVFYCKNDINKYAPCDFPKYKETLSAEEVSRAIRIDSINEGLVHFQHSAPFKQGSML
jgi:GR25 family glycosyltransferase involved in LPS biosynthesis